MMKNPPASAGDTGDEGSIPGLGRSPGVGNGNPLQYFCWEISWTEKPGGLQSWGSQKSQTTLRDWAQTSQNCFVNCKDTPDKQNILSLLSDGCQRRWVLEPKSGCFLIPSCSFLVLTC